MFDIQRWADWTSKRTFVLQKQGFDTRFMFAEESRTSDNPAFFVDLDYGNILGRIIVWSTGDFDVSVHHDFSDEPAPISEFPTKATNANFEEIFDCFVKKVTG